MTISYDKNFYKSLLNTIAYNKFFCFSTDVERLGLICQN